MRTNSFYCGFCEKITTHYELTLQEVAAMNAEEEKTIKEKIGNRFSELLGGVADWGNITKMYETITGEVPYKCSCCNICCWRNSRGEDVGLVSSHDMAKVMVKELLKKK